MGDVPIPPGEDPSGPTFVDFIRPGQVIDLPALGLHISYREGESVREFLRKACEFWYTEMLYLASRGELPYIKGDNSA